MRTSKVHRGSNKQFKWTRWDSNGVRSGQHSETEWFSTDWAIWQTICFDYVSKGDRNQIEILALHIIIAKSLGKTQIECVRQSGSNCIRYCVASKSATYWEPISKALQLYLTNNLSVLWTWSLKFPQLSSLTLRVKPTFDSDESWMKTLFIATVKTEDVTPGSINHWSYWTAIINQSEHLERYLKKN